MIKNRTAKRPVYVIIYKGCVIKQGDLHFVASELEARDFFYHARFANEVILAVSGCSRKLEFSIPLKHVDHEIEVFRYSTGIIGFPISIYRLLAKTGDIIHYDYRRGFVIGLIATFLRKKKVLVLDADITDELAVASRNYHYPIWKRSLIRLCRRLLLAHINISARLADLVLCVGEGPADTLERMGLAEKTRVIIASNILLKEVIPEENVAGKWDRPLPLRIVIPTQLRYKKGVHVVLEALKILPQESRSKLEAHVVGKGSFADELKESSRSLSGTVSFRSPVPYGPNFFNLLDQKQIAIVPQLSNEQPRVILDVMARGLLVIASDTLGNRTIIQHKQNGLLYSRNSPGALANLLNEVLEQAELRPDSLMEMSLEGRRFAATHTVDAVHAERDKILMALSADLGDDQNS
jgi:glycosyltransferase involved in cell wall biosynthesis